jgi:hypothetical protein
LENLGIWRANKFAGMRVLEIDRRLSAPETNNDLMVEISVRLETWPHAIGRGAAWRAASSLA